LLCAVIKDNKRDERPTYHDTHDTVNCCLPLYGKSYIWCPPSVHINSLFVQNEYITGCIKLNTLQHFAIKFLARRFKG